MTKLRGFMMGYLALGKMQNVKHVAYFKVKIKVKGKKGKGKVIPVLN
jgi:hypothetical protein